MTETPTTRRHLPLILLLFFGSGAAALVYEVVWFQMLQMVVGSTAVSLAVVLATYMGGMCIGSLLLPRKIGQGRHPLRVYALIELGIGIIALLVLLAMPLVDTIYAAIGGPGFLGILFRGLICALCLLPADHPHGGDPARGVALGRIHPGGRFLAGLPLQRQYGRSGRGLRPGRLLPPPRP